MKYGNLVFKREGRFTIGDDIQILAIEKLYEYMGVNYNEVQRIDYRNIGNYDGEYVILPINFPIYGCQGDKIFNISEKIIPVFLGLSLLATSLDEKDVQYLKRYQPIGCRDYRTVTILKKYGIVSYLNGCITSLLPLRKNTNADRIYCVDVEDDILKYMPKNIRKDAEFKSHMYYTSSLSENSEIIAKRVINEYKEKAKLIITSRLHCALPCSAMGIPVIMVKNKLSFRFVGNIDHISFYQMSEYDKINWNQQPIYYETEKKRKIEHDIECIKSAYEFYSSYEENEKNDRKPYPKLGYVEFLDNTYKYIEENISKDENFEYILWGMTQTAISIYDYLSNNYTKAKLIDVVDKKEGIVFLNHISKNSKIIEEKPNKFVFVCTGNAIQEANNLFEEIGKNDYYQCCSDNEEKYVNSKNNIID